ncbi:MAG: biotin--[acetyl-CoA-carboxylase] ligase [Acutalibacteraceae bacterium]
MTIKQQVLEALINKKGESVSGEQLAKELFCSRNAVWKAIKSLKDDGYKIDAVTNKGYCLKEESSLFSATSLESVLNNKCNVILLESIDSTNNYLKKLAEKGAQENTVVIANTQTGGKGRMGRSFYSQNGLYLSILLKPKFPAEKSLFITTAAAVAVAEAIESVSGKKAKIKWVNDVFIDDKKVCGILTEAAMDLESGGLNYAVLGIGINIYNPDGFPKEIENIAGTVFETEPESDVKLKLTQNVINNFFDIYNNIENSDFMKKYKEKSLIIGKKINVLKDGKSIEAKAIDIDENAKLLVEYPDKTLEKLYSGEVSINLRGVKNE